MAFSDTEMMELGRKHPTNIHNIRSLIRTVKHVLDILQMEEAFTVEECKHTYTYTYTHTHTHTYTHTTMMKDNRPTLFISHYYGTSLSIVQFPTKENPGIN